MKKQKAAISPRRNSQQNLEYVSIVALSPPTIQWQSDKRLNQAIRRQELTNSLEIREWYGFDGDTAILVINEFVGRAAQ